jgi:hypothetical protein
LAGGIVQATASDDQLLDLAITRARELAPLGSNREVYGGQKERLYGENAVINQGHGAAHMLRNADKFRH